MISISGGENRRFRPSLNFYREMPAAGHAPEQLKGGVSRPCLRAKRRNSDRGFLFPGYGRQKPSTPSQCNALAARYCVPISMPREVLMAPGRVATPKQWRAKSCRHRRGARAALADHFSRWTWLTCHRPSFPARPSKLLVRRVAPSSRAKN